MTLHFLMLKNEEDSHEYTNEVGRSETNATNTQMGWWKGKLRLKNLMTLHFLMLKKEEDSPKYTNEVSRSETNATNTRMGFGNETEGIKGKWRQ